MGIGALVGVGVFLAASASPLGLTLLGRLILLVSIPVLILGIVHGLRDYLGVVTLVLVGAILRLTQFSAQPRIDDGPFYLQMTQDFLSGHVTTWGHVASSAVWSIFVSLFDYSGVNVANFFFSVLTIPIVGAIAYRQFESRRAAVGGMAAFTFAPIAIWYAPKAMNEPVALFFLATAIYLVLSDRQSFAFVVGFFLVFMRIEYAILFLLPFVIFHGKTDARVRNVSIAVPILGVFYVFASGVIGVPVPLQGLILAPLNDVDLFSPVTFRSLFQDPAHVFVARYESLAAHLSHFGLPYWKLFLVNPLIPVLAWAGVSASTEGRTKTGVYAAFSFFGFWLVTLQTTLLPGNKLLTFLTIGMSLVGFSMLAVIVHRDNREPGALFLATFVYSLGFLLFSPAARYLLPVVLSFSVYGGRTIALALEEADQYATER